MNTMNTTTHVHLPQALRRRYTTLLAGTIAALVAAQASATNGYFSHGYGSKAEGIAGVAVALPQDALAAASNPAGTAAVGERADLGLTVFLPRRSAAIVGNAFGADAAYEGNGKSSFFIPDFGWTKALSPATAAGIAVYGNGGMNTDYSANPYARFGASGSAGVNLEQLFITPSIAHKLDERNTLGVAANIAYQRFSAKGIALFGAFSSASSNVSDRGTDTSTGVGVRVGWLGQLTPNLSVGATWASAIRGKFSQYRGLFADGGRFDVPENLAVGVAARLSERLTLAADVRHIRYSRVAAVGNSAASLFAGQPLGSNNGPGFGWRDQTVFKLGAQYDLQEGVTLRGGLSTANQVVPASETFFNILAPGVVTRHASLGFTVKRPGGHEWSGFYTLALGQNVRGSQSIPSGVPPAGLGGGNANVRLKEHIFGVSHAWSW